MIDASPDASGGAAATFIDANGLAQYHADLLKWRVFETMGSLNRDLRARRSAMSRDEWSRWIRLNVTGTDIQRLLLQSAFSGRANAKPRGYAGDAVMIDLIYDGLSAEGLEHTLAYAICRYELSTQSCVAVRQRREYAATRMLEHGRRGSRILSVACGHLREVDPSVLKTFSDETQIVALDQDADSLATVSEVLRDKRVNTQRASILDVVTDGESLGAFDFIYTLGLYDYLDQRIARALTKRLSRMLRSDGELLIANFAPEVLDVGYMEAIMDWWLVYRDEDRIYDLLSGVNSAYSSTQVFRDPNEVIVYLNIRK